MKQEVKRTIVTHTDETPVESENTVASEMLDQPKHDIPTSRVEVSDNDIPSFIKKLKNRF